MAGYRLLVCRAAPIRRAIGGSIPSSASMNAKIGLRITALVGTMACAYLFTALALISLPAAVATGDKIVIVAWIAQTFLQLVLLPIILVGQNIQGERTEKRDQETHDAVVELLTSFHAKHDALHEKIGP